MKSDRMVMGYALAALVGLTAGFAACAHEQRPAQTRGEPARYWESELQSRPSSPAPGTRVETWPMVNDAGNLVGPDLAPDRKPEGTGTTDKLLWQDAPLPAPPAAQEPHRLVSKAPDADGGIPDAGPTPAGDVP
jgi:hypothetical protein